jgi:hypothetical protein
MKLKSQPAPPPLDAATVAILLAGWHAKPCDGTPADTSAAFDLFTANTPGCAQLWRRHEDFLRGEARRLGMQPCFRLGGRVLFFAELCAEEIQIEVRPCWPPDARRFGQTRVGRR